ncbi:hypothetical protein PPL_01225 [Heterostelium album PN500]|uniref:B box-type domain-containing protein n=1 Tax=Heterostelium pallidum (strain ATCC 26659 / Pp 5 / PN500) TaxID=670386 RepID=D3AYG5_HETP5|nr:hypothetical protein PPL_01225 [Heterostelium album PN500]EFA85992.1 hypothetical protein PPL_01225 [Heterostelium album PN500]|eukprot:XP_020438098.1 hypothetical protein PPL_01225 [Heterostelium album PN500]
MCLHNKTNLIICRNCSITICDDCVKNDHHGHSIIQSLDYKQRLNDLWNALNLQSDAYQYSVEKEKEITSHYENLHRLLATEEHNLKKPIVEQKQQSEQKIDNILSEIQTINHLIASTTTTTSLSPTTITTQTSPDIDQLESDFSDSNNLYQSRIESIVSTIKESSGINQLLCNRNLIGGGGGNTKQLTISELLETMQQTKTLEPPIFHEIKVDIDKMSSLRSQLRDSIRAVPVPSKQLFTTFKPMKFDDRKEKHMIFSIGARGNDISIFNPYIDMEIRSLSNVKPPTTLPLNDSLYSMVKLGMDIYLFGGVDSSSFCLYNPPTQSFLPLSVNGDYHVAGSKNLSRTATNGS